jgi:predicted enzyme involved in methoxymalonyl-ACP biosynthesis
MSCRVIGRTVETAMLGTVVEHARQRGAIRLVGPFLATAKNAPAKEIYAAHGFHCAKKDAEQSFWELDLASTRLATPEWIECRIVQQQGAS